MFVHSVINDQADPGFRAGDTPMIGDTRIPAALSSRSETLVLEPENQLATLLVSVRSDRGHDMGWIGVTLDSRTSLAPAQTTSGPHRKLSGPDNQTQ